MPTCISTQPTATVSTPYTVTSAVLPVSVAQIKATATGTVASASAPSTTQSRSAAIIPLPDSPLAKGLSDSGTAIGTSADCTTAASGPASSAAAPHART